MSHTTMLNLLHHWAEQGAIRRLDQAFASFIHQQLPDSSDELLLAAALVSERTGHGHVCLDLSAVLRQPEHWLNQSQPTADPQQQASAQLARLLGQLSLSHWLDQLSCSSAVANCLDGASSNLDNTPLVLSGSSNRPLLYLRRYWHYEQQISSAINQRLSIQPDLALAESQQLIAQLFSDNHSGGTDWQKVACLLAARNQFAIITGGPGTGKTTTVVRLLALLQGLRLSQGQSKLQIHLAAPTGKAAARLSESISGSIQRLQLDSAIGESIKQSIPSQVTTLHRLLGSRPDSRHFRHHAANPLPTDLVVVDEASMMDVDMMSKLVSALPAHARLILLGDKDQLASVEAGSVLADLCQGADSANYHADTSAFLQQMGIELEPEFIAANGSKLQQATCMLRHSYRFSAHPGIGALASAVNSGAASPATLEQIIATHPESLHRLKLQPNNQQLPELEQLAVDGYRHYLSCLKQQQPDSTQPQQLQDWALAVFAAHNSFQLLTAMRKGLFGVESLNLIIQRALQQQGLLSVRQGSWYHGRPILITRNEYSLRLMNGDIGICMQWADGSLRVAFPDGAGGIRWILPSRLQAAETVFAMTVHKSQGSEFTHTALVLPDHHSPVLSKELIYTAITRSKEVFTLAYSNQHALQQALTSSVERASGLQGLLL